MCCVHIADALRVLTHPPPAQRRVCALCAHVFDALCVLTRPLPAKRRYAAGQSEAQAQAQSGSRKNRVLGAGAQGMEKLHGEGWYKPGLQLRLQTLAPMATGGSKLVSATIFMPDSLVQPVAQLPRPRKSHVQIPVPPVFRKSKKSSPWCRSTRNGKVAWRGMV